MDPQTISNVMQALGRIEQKIDDHLCDHERSERNIRWALAVSVSAIAVAVAAWAK